MLHTYNILDNDPSWFENVGETENLEGCIFTFLATGFAALGQAVIRAFGRCQNEVNVS